MMIIDFIVRERGREKEIAKLENMESFISFKNFFFTLISLFFRLSLNRIEKIFLMIVHDGDDREDSEEFFCAN